MTQFLSKDSFLSIGGRLVSTVGPLVNGALTAAATSMNIDGTNLSGVVGVGDTFTLAGETGSPVHTVTGGPFYVAVADAITGITFTPGIAAGGVADNAGATFLSNSIAEARLWNFDIRGQELDGAKFGDNWGDTDVGIFQVSGRGEAFLDYGDAKQAVLVDRITGASPSGATVEVVLFGVSDRKQWYAGVELVGAELSSQRDELARIVFQFKGRGGAVDVDWN